MGSYKGPYAPGEKMPNVGSANSPNYGPMAQATLQLSDAHRAGLTPPYSPPGNF
jgi:hypothetical protein